MKFYTSTLLILFVSLFSVSSLSAQCPAGEVELSMVVSTDLYGYEGYWEIVPGGNNCGVGTLAFGGNNAVGCLGGGDQDQAPGGYGNNLDITEGPWCVVDGSDWDLYFVDDWGDGGFGFEMIVNGFTIDDFSGTGEGNTFPFTAAEPLTVDATLNSIVSPVDYTAAGSIAIELSVFNAGIETINSLEISYSINGGVEQTATISGLNIENFEQANVEHPTLWNEESFGTYTIQASITAVNGETDLNPTDNEASKVIELGPGIPNIIDFYIGASVNIEEVGNAGDQLDGPTDLDFHPFLNRKELWVINKRIEAIGGTTVTYFDTGTDDQEALWRIDGNAWHFMSMPTGIAFGDNDFFGTSPGVYDANHNGGEAFTGPTLWNSDPAIYAQPSGGNGSHMDMLHASPQCQGIAHERDNVYWVFDGYNNDIVRYDFAEDHGPGADDHSDGVIYRYSEDAVAKDASEKVVSHLILDKETGWLYVVDNDNQRVFRIDINTGNLAGIPSYGPYEAIADYRYVTGYTQEAVISTGLIEPAGIDLVEDRLLVSDYATGEIIIYDISSMPATELGRVSTEAEGIMGIKVGPDGFIYYVDYDADKVMVAKVSQPTSIEDVSENQQLTIFPNPASSGEVSMVFPQSGFYSVSIINELGQLISEELVQGERILLQNTLTPGFYLVTATDMRNDQRFSTRLIIAE